MAPPTDNDLDRGARIKALRLERGWQQKELAKNAGGVSLTTIGNWESGKPIRQGMLVTLAAALGTTPEYIATGATGVAAPAAPADNVRSAVARLERALSDHDQLARDHFHSLNVRVSALDSQLAALEATTADVLAALMTLRQQLADATKPAAGERRQPNGPSTIQPANG